MSTNTSTNTYTAFTTPPPIAVHYFHTKLRHKGDFIICPYTLELLFYAKVLNQPFTFVAEQFSTHYRSFGFKHYTLPVAFDCNACKTLDRNCLMNTGEQFFVWEDDGYISQDAAFERLSYVGNDGVSAEQESFVKMLSLQAAAVEGLDRIIEYLLWMDEQFLLNFTKPLILNSSPKLYGLVEYWRMKEAKQSQIKRRGADNKQLILSTLKNSLKSIDGAIPEYKYIQGFQPTLVDAAIFSRLSILLSLPLTDKDFKEVLAGYPKLYNYCKHLNDTHGVWSNASTFLLSEVTEEGQTEQTETEVPTNAFRRGQRFALVAICLTAAVLGVRLSSNIKAVD